MPVKHASLTNSLLREARLRRGWTQRQVAEAVGATPVMVSRWEGGVMRPGPHYRQQLCVLFGTSAEALGFVPPGMHEAALAGVRLSQQFWNVPFRRNPFFTGREELLAHLHHRLRCGVPQALTGLGGIGKTHTATEYAYRYRDTYQAVFWLRAETRELLLADLTTLAGALGVADPTDRDQSRLLKAMQMWLHTHPGWLVILDNVEDLPTLADLLPDPAAGAVLLTTRTPVTGTLAQALELPTLAPAEGALLLLRRAKRLGLDAPLEAAPPAEQAQARTLATLFEGLPLALDQAGAYLEETGCRLEAYLDHYQTQRAALLARRGEATTEHPASVLITFSLALKHLERRLPEAAALLQLCAFLLPDAIPLDLLGAGADALDPPLRPLLSDPLVLDTTVTTLRQAALIQRHPEADAFSLHRLVQAILIERLDEPAQRTWAEQALRLVQRAFPDSGEEATWPLCQRYLPQAYAGVRLAETWNLRSLETGQFLTRLGAYLQEQSLYAQAEALLCQALTTLAATIGEQHPALAACCNELGLLYHYQGRLSEAEALYRRAFSIRQACFDEMHPTVLESLNNLGGLAYAQGRYAQAEALLQEVLEKRRLVFGPEHPEFATTLHNLGGLAGEQGHYAQAQAHLQRALLIREQVLGRNHLHTALTMNRLAIVLTKQGQYAEALALQQQALAIREQVVGANHPYVAASLSDLAQLAEAQGRDAQAEALYHRALPIQEETLGSAHPRTLATRQRLECLRERRQATAVRDPAAVAPAQASRSDPAESPDAQRHATAHVGAPHPDHPVTELSQREREILALLAAGCSNREIAEALVVAVSTVKWQLKILYSKLQVHSRTQAIAQANTWRQSPSVEHASTRRPTNTGTETTEGAHGPGRDQSAQTA